jgi:hypothetical protein
VRGRLRLVALCALVAACSAEPSASTPAAPAAESPTPREEVVTAPTVTATPGTPTPDPGLTDAPSPRPEEAAPCTDPLGCYAEPVRVGTFDAVAIPGASGLVASRRDPTVLYLLDDRPGTDEIWAVRTDGTMIGPVGVAGLDALDTEALALGPCGPTDPAMCVYVGDIGDNLRSRTDITVHRFPEPDLTTGPPVEPVAADVIRLRYPDGAQEDAEALLVDDEGVPLIVTKARFDRETGQTGPTRLLRAPGWADGMLVDLGELAIPEPAIPLQSRFVGNVVTGGDQLPGRVVLRTYDQVVELVAAEPTARLETLASWMVHTPPAPFEVQSEAIAYAPDGCGYYTVGEGSGDIWFTACR